MKIAVCDDEEKDLELICHYCKQFDSGIEIHSFSSGIQLLRAFESEFYELIFLDIEMKKPNGYEVGQMLVKRERKPLVVFTTKTVNYAVRGYGIALRYLLKPIAYESFAPVMRLALEKILPEKIFITQGNIKKILNSSDVIYIEVLQHQICFHCRDCQILTVRGTLFDIMSQLKRSWFVQVHKSYCVNMDCIDRTGQNILYLIDGSEIPIGSGRRKEVQKKLQIYLKTRSRL